VPLGESEPTSVSIPHIAQTFPLVVSPFSGICLIG
jgi:hypothetical protein